MLNSHRAIWRQIVESGSAQSWIINADCAQHPQLDQLLSAYQSSVPGGWDVIVLGGYYERPPKHIDGHVFQPAGAAQIHGYMIRPDACRRLLLGTRENLSSVSEPPPSLNIYALWPNLVFPQSGDSFTSFSELGIYGPSRFGNQLFQVAATIASAARHGFRPRLPVWEYAHHFAEEFDQSANHSDPVEKYIERQFHFVEIPHQPNLDIVGFLQSPKYFAGFANLIRAYFRPSRDVQSEVDHQRAKMPRRPTVAVHIRRGDYLSMPERFRVLPIEYYQRAMQIFGSDFQFAIFGDDPAWAAQTFRGDNIQIIAGNSEVTDLHLIASCDHQIIANSSFSWWGAWLNANPHKRVIAPDPWFGPALNYDTRDLLPPEWTKLRA